MANQLIHFGKLSLLYEDGFVRYVRAGELEIVRKIFFALRDSNWNTADIVRTDERISVTWKGFEISYTATNIVDGKNVFRWFVKISGNESGEIDFSVDGETLAEYTRNRAGICVLHPVRDTRDKLVKVTRPDQTGYEGEFPKMINPYQPFMDIRKMSWELSDGAWAELEFEGDVFETEDQRNWSDTSFKTYSTPLSVPYPVVLKPGDRVKQRVKLKLINGENLPASELAEDIEVKIHDNDSKALPKIGAEFPADIPISQKEIALLRELHFEHLRIELVLSSLTWRQKLKAGLEEAAALSTKPFVHLIMSDDADGEWTEFVKEVGSNISIIYKLAISPVERKADVDTLVRTILPKARQVFPQASIGAGFRSYFTELNRNRFDYSGIDFVIYPVNPQAHSTDTHTIIENIPVQEDAVKSAHAFTNNKKVHVGLVTIKQRFNPDARPGPNERPREELFDERQSTALAAGWMLASVKYLTEGGADAVTLFETHGRAGYISDDEVFPVYNALLSFKKLDPKSIISSTCNEPLIITSLVVEDDNNKKSLILINHTSLKKSVTVGEDLYTLGDHEIQFIPMSK
jgi:hypothetical protein